MFERGLVKEIESFVTQSFTLCDFRGGSVRVSLNRASTSIPLTLPRGIGPKCYIRVVSFFVFSGLSFNVPLACGFDPTTIATGLQAIGGMPGAGGGLDEAADVGFALGDLLSDLDIPSESEAEVTDAVRRLEELNSKAREFEWSKDELKQALEVDLKRAGSLSQKIRALKDMVAASKRIAVIMGLRPKAGEKAVRIQEIKINSMILEELQSIRRAQFLAYLEDKEERTKRELYLRKVVQEERSSSKAKIRGGSL